MARINFLARTDNIIEIEKIRIKRGIFLNSIYILIDKVDIVHGA